MEIGLIVDDQNINGSFDGIATYILNLLRQLDSLKVDGIVFNPFHLQSVKFDHLESKTLAIPSFLNQHVQKLFFYSSMYYHARMQHCQLPPILHNLSCFPFPFKLASRHQKYVVTVHDLTTFKFPFFHPLGRSLGYRIGLKSCLQKADGIIAVSQSTKQDLIKVLGIREDKIKVIHLGVDHQQFRPVFDECVLQSFRKRFGLKNPYILFVGIIEPRKNLTTLLKAFKLFKDVNNVPHDLVIAGRLGWKVENLRKIVENSSIKKHVIFTGHFPQRYLHLLYNCADVVVYPSWYEGFGLPVVEAMACGTPVLVANRSSLPEIVDHDEMLTFDPSDAFQLGKKLEEFIVDRKMEDKALQHRLLKRAGTFTWKKTALNTLGFYESIMT